MPKTFTWLSVSIFISTLTLTAITVTNGDDTALQFKKCTEYVPTIALEIDNERCLHQCADFINEVVACDLDGLNLLNCSKTACPLGYQCENIVCQTFKCKEATLREFKLCRKPSPNERYRNRGKDYERRYRYGYSGENPYFRGRSTGLKSIIIPIISMVILVGIVIIAVVYCRKRRQNRQRQAYAIQMAPTSGQPGLNAQPFPSEPLLPQLSHLDPNITGYPNYPVHRTSYPNYRPSNYPRNQMPTYPLYNPT